MHGILLERTLFLGGKCITWARIIMHGEPSVAHLSIYTVYYEEQNTPSALTNITCKHYSGVPPTGRLLAAC